MKSKFESLLFAHDEWLTREAGGGFVAVSYTPRLVDRLLYLADRVTLAVRCRPGQSESRQVRESKNELGRPPRDLTVLCVPNIKTVRGLRDYFIARRIVAEAVRTHDVVIARLPSRNGAWAFSEARAQGKPVLVEFVGCPWDALWNHSGLGKLLAPAFFVKNRYLLKRSKYTVYVTNSFLQRRYPAGGESISCANVEIVPIPEARLVERVARVRGSVVSMKCTLATVGAVDVPYKGQHLVIEALAHLRSAGFDARYLVIGGGDPTRLSRLAESLGVLGQVEFRGSLPHSEVLEALDRVDIYLQPSRQEGLPRALIEAMSRGCAALGSDAGGIPELLDPQCVVRPLSAHAIARAIQAGNAQFWTDQAQRNWRVSQEYTYEVLDARRKSFYDRFLRDVLPVRGRSFARNTTEVGR